MKHRQTNNVSIRKREVTQPQQHTEYYLFNSQGNLKAYSDDIMSFAYYGYNAANTRAYKISLYNTNLWINGQQQPLNLQLQQAMFYPNTYINFNQNGEYTKHYYNGTERIASRLGDNSINIALDNSEHFEPYRLQLEDSFKEDIQELISEPTQVDMPPMLDILNLQPTGTPNDIYYYHPNHLGSTSFVTDQNQNITQGFLYAPFGEITTEYNINFGNNVIPKYSFNAKELDEETGMYYYEARYYKPPVFTSRDPMFEKYFWMTPYAYCANNPVKYVDPSGEDIWDVNQETGKVTRTEDKTKDVIRIVDNDGNVINDANGTPQTLTYDYGTIKHYTTKKNGYDVFRIRDDKKGTALFELMANNTNVEWTQFKTGQSGDKGLNFITTSHSPDEEAAGTHLYNKQLRFKYFIREHIHNHPTSIPVPSGMPGTIQEGEGDISFASYINSYSQLHGYKLPIYKVYMKGYGYNEYNANSQVSDFINIYMFFGKSPKMK